MKLSVTTIVRDASRFGGGILNVARPLHTALLKLGVDATFLSSNTPDEPITHAYLSRDKGLGFTDLPRCLMRSVVHIHGIWTPFEYLAFREARRRRARIVISPHGALEPWAFHNKPTKKFIAWWLYQKRILQAADLLIVNSDQERQRLRALGLRPPVATLANGVDLNGFPEQNTMQRERTVLFFGRIDPKKGIPDLINAWAALPDHNNHRLIIHGYGDAAYITSIERQITASGRSDIALLPPVFGAARWNIFTRASIYVLPSYSENFGITVAEALTAGLPVVTTRATPWGDLADQDLGWIVCNNVEQLRDALQTAISLNRQRLLAMRLRAHDYAINRFNWDAIAARYLNTYTWLLRPALPTPDWIDRG